MMITRLALQSRCGDNILGIGVRLTCTSKYMCMYGAISTRVDEGRKGLKSSPR